MIKFLIGGSPCTAWSIAQSKNRETEPQGLGWELFRNFLIAKERFKPDFFLYENNKSAAKPIKEQISIELGVPLRYINSALVSAQNRERFYAHNFGNVPQPEDRGILLVDILESGVAFRGEKSCCLDASYYKGGNLSGFEKQSGKRLMVAIPVCVNSKSGRNGIDGLQPSLSSRIYDINGKHTAVTTCHHPKIAEPAMFQCARGFNKGGIKYDKTPTLTASKYQDNNFVIEGVPSCLRYERTETGKALRKQYESGEIGYGYNEHKRLCSRPDGKTNTLTTVGKDNMICTPVYAVNTTADGKSHCLRATYYKDGIRNMVGNDVDKRTCVGVHVCVNAVKKPIYEVKNGYITIKEKKYPIKLPDGFYIIRKLTVTECCRLQTLPDFYCRAVSASQGYKGLGNGWTAEVIIHLLSYALRDTPKDDKIIVLSMYDGIGTGRYCFDMLGYNNIAYYSYEVDKYAIQVAVSNYPDIIRCGDAFQVRKDDWFMERAVKMWERFYSK